MKYLGLDHIPTYNREEVLFHDSSDVEWSRAFADTNNTHIIRQARLNDHFTPKVRRGNALAKILKITDTHLKEIAGLDEEILSVVDYSWGFTPTDETGTKNTERIVPKGLSLVARVEIVRPAKQLVPRGALDLAIRDTLLRYTTDVPVGEVFLGEAAQSHQCVVGPERAVLVDIEPWLSIKTGRHTPIRVA